MTKDEILSLAKQKGIKLSYLNTLIDGYRGKLTDWKNNKTTLTENEVNVISNYLKRYINAPNPEQNGKNSDGDVVNSQEIIVPKALQGVLLAFNRGEFEDLTQSEIDALASIALTLKAQRLKGADNDKA